jgi:L-fuculose-phosphate aldolase
MVKHEMKLRKLLAEYTRLTYNKGYTPPLNGNLSVRLDEDHILITPSYFCKGKVTEQDLLLVNMDGEVVGEQAKPSVETGMHLAIYKKRPEINAVVHAHPKAISTFAVANRPINTGIMPESIYLLGEIANIPYYMPGTNELRDAVGAQADHDSYLLYNHGMITVGRNMPEAFYRLESMELCAYLELASAAIGGAVAISQAEKEKLMEVRRGILASNG